jgi:hypothetical protein
MESRINFGLEVILLAIQKYELADDASKDQKAAINSANVPFCGQAYFSNETEGENIEASFELLHPKICLVKHLRFNPSISPRDRR